MTRVSELFYNRRSRIGRETPELGLGLESAVDRNPHHHHNLRHRRYHQHRYDDEGSDPSRRSPHARHPCHRLSQADHESVRLGLTGGQSGTGNNINRETSSSRTNRPRFTRNETLPGAVLLARERLLERLSSVSLSGNRQNNIASSSISWNEFTFNDEISLVTDPLSPLQNSQTKPPGLNHVAMNWLQKEVFSFNVKDNEEISKRIEEKECSICLDIFHKGDEVICLPCGHTFHYGCLDPWVRTCGDCPYCRTAIYVA